MVPSSSDLIGKSRQSSPLTRALTLAFASMIAFQPAFTPLLVRAAAMPEGNGGLEAPVVLVSPAASPDDLPAEGALDQIHGTTGPRNDVSRALYALRNVAVKDLLEERKALKLVMGGSLGGRARAQSVGFDTLMGAFRLPRAILDLYDGPKAPVEITRAMHELKAEPSEAATRKARLILLTTLARQSSNLARYEQASRFLRDDFWKNPEIEARFWEREVQADFQADALLNGPEALQGIGAKTKAYRDVWMKKHGTKAELEQIESSRHEILNEHRLLNQEIQGKALHSLIYDELRRSFGFPDPQTVQTPVARNGKPYLPEGTDPIEIPADFDRRMDSALDALERGAADGRLAEALDALVDRALVGAHTQNNAALIALGKDRSYTGQKGALLELASHPELWERARERFAYLSSRIDFDAAQATLEAYFARRKLGEKIFVGGGYALALGTGILAAVGTRGAAIPIAGRILPRWAPRVWGVISGVLASSVAVPDYLLQSARARLEKSLFEGSRSISKVSRAREAVLIEKAAFTSMIASLASLGVSASVFVKLGRAKTLVDEGGRKMVQLSETADPASREVSALARLRSTVSEIELRAAGPLAPATRAALAPVRQALAMPSTSSTRLVSLEEGMQMVATRHGVPVSAVRARLEKIPPVKYLMELQAGAVRADPGFMSYMWTEQRSGFVTTMIAEYLNYEDAAAIWNHKGQVTADMVQSFIYTWGMTALVTRGDVHWLTRAKQVAVLGGLGSVIPQVALNAIQYADNPDPETIQKLALGALGMGAWGAVFATGSGMPRQALTRYVNGKMNEKLILNPGQFSQWLKKRVSASAPAYVLKGGKEAYSQLNNNFGSWHYVWISHATGIVSSEKPADADPSTGSGAYIRVETPATDESVIP